ncbi:MAG: lysine-sensitive aspartokinase 3 [Candidatus Cryptobacteroides sp.]
MIVMKFGGTSVANYEAVSRMISIVEGKLSERPVVVVSALSKVTDLLYRLADAAAASDRNAVDEMLVELRERHLNLAKQLLEGKDDICQEALKRIDGICDSLASFVCAVCSLGELTPRSKAKIIANGEWLSSNIICYAMNARGIRTGFVDARNIMITSNDYLKGEPVISEIQKRAPEEIGKAYEGKDAVITQGFISSSENGEPTVLGRGGSDYSASLIGMAMDATRIEIWTDVDGVRTADPRVVPNTKSIEKISFEEAAEMAHFGAKVLHPLTIEPAVMKDIPVYVLNSMNPSGKGTAILKDEMIGDGVKSVSFKENILLLNIFSTRMINVSGFLQKVFAIFSEHKVSVDLISTSEANISLTMDGNQNINKVVEELSKFAQVDVDRDKSQVSVIGKNIGNLKGVLRQTMTSLSGCNVYMISQGASFVNISFVVDRSSLRDAVNATHKCLFE